MPRSATSAPFAAALVIPALAAGLLFSAPASGQDRATLADLALSWSLGRYATPVICEFDGRPVRGIRRVYITPGPRHVRPAVAKVAFVDLDADDASRCFTELRGDTPNLTGSFQMRIQGTWRPDTAQRDLREQLRRKQGFEYEIVAGGLRVQTIEQPPSEPRGVDFRGGRVVLREIDPASDMGRLIAGFDSPRKLLLELSASDGTKLSFPLYMTDPP